MNKQNRMTLYVSLVLSVSGLNRIGWANVTTSTDGLLSTNSASATPKKIMAHYMPWYQSKPVSGSWGWHWTMNHFNPPTSIASHYHSLFGPYDSRDPHVLASQALLMKFAGIDGMIADWYGIENFWDYGRIRDATNDFIPYIKKARLEFSICYEDQSIKHMLENNRFANRNEAVTHGAQVMEWLENNYFNHPSYQKIDNRPVLLCFGPQFFTSSEWTTLFNGLNPKPQFFPLQYHDLPSTLRTGEYNWPGPQSGTTPSSPTPSTRIVNDLTSFYNRADTFHWQYFIDGAFPRFHDIYAQAGTGPSYGYIDDQYAAFGTTYSYTLERALQSTSDIVQLITWNDYGEGTIIEPTEEDRYMYLETTQTLRKKHIDPNFPYTAADLRLPIRLYTLRKANLSNPTVMAQLNTAEDYLFADKLKEAQKLLDQIECSNPVAGDLDGDCRINLFDFELLSYAWLSGPADLNWNPAYDISNPKDDRINLFDLHKLSENWLALSF
ncbi:MAG: hypothetical protein ABFD91_03140 [Anaerohalosphaeraceae bacterium]